MSQAESTHPPEPKSTKSGTGVAVGVQVAAEGCGGHRARGPSGARGGPAMLPIHR